MSICRNQGSGLCLEHWRFKSPLANWSSNSYENFGWTMYDFFYQTYCKLCINILANLPWFSWKTFVQN